MKYGLITILFCLFSVMGMAEKVYDFSPVCQQAYAEIMKLRLEPGKQLLQQARQQNPDNLIPELLEGYIDFFELFFNEDPKQYQARKQAFEKRINAFDEGPTNSPFYRYCKGLAYMQRAAVRIKFSERYGAGWDFKKANSLIKDNRSKYPSFQPNNMIYGPLMVIIGTVPSGYKWITSLFGMRGSVSGGMKMMRNFINSNDPYAKLFGNEAIFYYCYLMYYVENKPDEVFKFIQARKLDVVNNHLYTFMAANLYINNKQTNNAEAILKNMNTSPGYLQTPVWDLELGLINLHQLQLDAALQHLTAFVDDFKGNFYVKDALLKIGWAHYLKGNMAEAERYRLLCIKRGNVDSDADKKAYKDAKAGNWPNPLLLKARLLNDGGYNKEALAQLHGKSEQDFDKPAEALEFSYRVARIYDDLGRDDEAIKYYQRAIALGKSRTEYYAARAALQMGYIYEKRGQKSQAIAAFEECISMDDHDYKDSLDQRAKAGIARVKGD
ncbi:tetratricopeptide repeat protein [Aridibaculum aurantiacum]|uniref:tetratricopeptide repeat protein n=1 Tax=Aridibaculum aurantiacum TaxID=2810307 RepID=UPI001A95ABB7|nr:tetratricopeptide repeat protein [Aridibaculum aurantiacum]